MFNLPLPLLVLHITHTQRWPLLLPNLRHLTKLLVLFHFQAALGPVALDLARAAKESNQAQLELAGNVLLISVLAIILTAPLGAILMLRLAPHWLKHGDAVAALESPTTPTPTNQSNANSNAFGGK